MQVPAPIKQPGFTVPGDALLRARAVPTQTLFALPVSARRLALEAASGADGVSKPYRGY